TCDVHAFPTRRSSDRVAAATQAVLRCLPAPEDGAALDAWLFDLPVRTMAGLLGIDAVRQAEAAAWTGDFVRCLLPRATPEQIARSEEHTSELQSREKL